MTSSQHPQVSAASAVAQLSALAANALPPVEHLVEAHVAIALRSFNTRQSTEIGHRRARRGFRVPRTYRAASVVAAVAVLATASLASANVLPTAMQNAIAGAAATIGLPVPHAHHGVDPGRAHPTTVGGSAAVRQDATTGAGAATSMSARELAAARQAAHAAHRHAAAAVHHPAHAATATGHRRNVVQRAAHPPAHATGAPPHHAAPAHQAGGHHVAPVTGTAPAPTPHAQAPHAPAVATPAHGSTGHSKS